MAVYPGRREGTWRVVVWSKGKAHEEIVEGTKTEARAWEAKMRLELQAGTISKSRAAPRFKSFCEGIYLPHARTALAASSLQTRISHLGTLYDFFGKERWTDIDTQRVEEYKRWRLESGTAASSINTELAGLQAARTWAIEMNVPVAAKCKFIMLEVPEGRVQVWTGEQVAAIFRSMRLLAPDLVPMNVFLANTGCRKGESLVAEWPWMDMRDRMVRIPVTKFWRPKSKKPREVPMSDALYETLETMPRHHERYVFASARYLRPYKHFPAERFAEVLEHAQVEGTPHVWRHTFASHFLRSCPDLFLLAKVLGHSHTRVTELYSHLLPGHLDRARGAVNFRA